MEVCVDSLESALNAARGRAKRIELCSALSEGGLTPSLGMLKVVKSHLLAPVFCMIRPRTGDFLYTDLEIRVMIENIEALLNEGADGLVFGCLTPGGKVDEEACSKLISVARNCKPGVELTFHRAIDLSADIFEAADTIQKLGFDRILTSGGQQTATLGMDNIRDLIEKYKGQHIIIFPGGGINQHNLAELLKNTDADEFHGSARDTVPSKMEYKNSSCSLGSHSSEYSRQVTSSAMVEMLTNIFKDVKILMLRDECSPLL